MPQQTQHCLRTTPAGSLTRRAVKRLFDLVTATTALLLLAPICVIVALAVAADLGRPVLFRQVRPGLGGQPFVILKFRTMRTAEPGRELMDDETRLTRLGHFLRRSSLDELPELLNVVKGDMSIVGPRPLLMEYVPRYTPEQARRQSVRPGITGLAQVNGRNALSWDDKFRLDVEYVDHQSLWLDVLLVIRTVRSVLQRDGIDAEGEIGSPEFTGVSDAPASAEP